MIISSMRFNPDEADPEARTLEKVIEYHSVKELVLPLYVPSILGFMSRSFVLAVLPLHVMELGYSYDDVGFFGTISGIGVIGGNIPCGRLLSAKGPRALVSSSYLFHIVAAACAALVTTEGTWGTLLFGAAFFLNGLGETAGILARQTVLAAAVPKSCRGSASSALGGTQRIGFTVGPLLAGSLATAAGLQVVYAIQAIVALIAAICTLFFMPFISPTQSLDTSASNAREKRALLDESRPSLVGVARQHWRILLRVATFVTTLTCMRQGRILLFSLEGHDRQFSQAFIGNVVAVSFGIDALLFPVAGKLMDGWGRTWTGALSLSVSVAGVLCLQIRSIIGFVSFAVVSGIGNGLSAGLALTLGGDLAPPACRAEFLTLYRTLFRSADLIVPALIGFVTEKFSLPLAGLGVCGLGVFGIVWALTCVTETLQQDKPVGIEATQSFGIQAKGIGKYQDLERAIEMPCAVESAVGDAREDKPVTRQ